MVGAQEPGERRIDGERAVVVYLGPLRDVPIDRVHRVGRLELPAVQRHVTGGLGARRGEALEEVLDHPPDHVQRLVQQHLAGEGALRGVDVHALRQELLDVVLDMPEVDVEVDAVGGAALAWFRRADQLLLRRQVQLRTVGDDGRAPVEGTAVGTADAQRAGPVQVVQRVAEQAEGEPADQRAGGDQPAPPAGARPPTRCQQHERRSRNDQRHADDAHHYRRGQHDPGQRGELRARRAPPGQHVDRGQQQHLEQQIGHDVVLDLHLIGVQHNRCAGQRRDPGPDAETPQQCVDPEAEGEAEQVLHRRHEGQAADREQRPQEQLVADRVDAAGEERTDVVEVAEGVDVEQRGPVGQLHDDPQCQSDEQKQRQQPVPAEDAPERGDHRTPWRKSAQTVRSPSVSSTFGV